ncbi:NTPase [Patescibacteria group bacterium]|nr:MAG: NTPase [Patescibacteria group bacterium]
MWMPVENQKIMGNSVKNLLVTGEPRIGKSTLIESVIGEFESGVGGFITREFRKNDERQGFEIITLDGQKAVLADKDFVSDVKVGKYGVNVENLERTGIPAIERALREKEIVVIDEIGNMEIVSEKFRGAVEKSLQSDRSVLATIHARSHPFTDAIKERADVQIFELTERNRERVKKEIIDLVKSLRSGNKYQRYHEK